MDEPINIRAENVARIQAHGHAPLDLAHPHPKVSGARGKRVPNVLEDLGEGPFKTKRDAMKFGNAEVYGEWFVAKVVPTPEATKMSKNTERPRSDPR